MANRHNGHVAHCEHALAFCERCEVPYCTKCNFEWAKPCTMFHSYYPNWTYTSPAPVTYVGWTTSTTELGSSSDVSPALAMNEAQGIVIDHAAHAGVQG